MDIIYLLVLLTFWVAVVNIANAIAPPG